MIYRAAKAAARHWLGWEIDQELARGFSAEISQALGRVFTHALARRLASDWLAVASPGKNAEAWLDLTYPTLGNTLREALRSVLTRIWHRGWALGEESARDALTALQGAGKASSGATASGSAAVIDGEAAYRSWLADAGIESINGISDTQMGDLAGALGFALDTGQSVDELAAEIASFADAGASVDVISTTELARAVSQAALSAYDAAGVTKVAWLTTAGACVLCSNNELAGEILTGDSFPSGGTAPPAHPNCRCVLQPAAMAGVDLLSIAQAL